MTDIEQFGLSDAFIVDVNYLRTRHRHTDALERELIRLHEAGTPPNMCDFGVTPETQKALMGTVTKELAASFGDRYV